MELSPVSTAVRTALERAQSGLAREASTVARSTAGTTSDQDLTGAVVRLPAQQLQAELAVELLKAEGKMLGALIDTKA